MNLLKFVKTKSNLKPSNLVLLVFLNLTVYTLGILITYFIGIFVDMLTYNPSKERIYQGTCILFAVGIFSIIGNIIFKYKLTDISSDMIFSINKGLLIHIKRLPLSFFTGKDPAYINQRVNTDCNRIVNFYTNLIIQISVQLISFIGIILILTKYDRILSLVAILSIPLYILLYIIFSKYLYTTNSSYIEEQNIFFSNMHKQLSNLKYIKLNCLYESLDVQLNKYYPKLKKKLLLYTKFSSIFFLTGSTIENIFNMFLYLYGGIRILNGNLTIGEFIIIKSYYILLLQTTNSVLNLLKSYPEALVSFNRLLELLNIPQEYDGEKKLLHINTVSIENLNFNIDNINLIKNFTYTFTKGNIYLIKGKNGAGKSTLLNLMLGLHNKTYTGKILFNGINALDLNLYDLRKEKISIVEQEPHLMFPNIEDELKNSILNTNSNSTIIKTLIKEFNLDNLNSKSNIFYSSENSNISGGEKQKISLIKAFAKNSDIFILDEPTSALDKESIFYLKESLLKNKKSKITFIVSHDKSLDDIADFIVNL